jgi:hypothetical protein
MKKSMIAAAVVATAFAASANAGWFTITNNTGNGTGTLPASGSVMDVSGTAVGQPGTDSLQTFSLADFNSVSSLIGLGTLASDTIHYFGMENNASGPAFFGFAYKASASISLNVNLDSTWGNPDGIGAISGLMNGTNGPGTVGAYAGGVFSSTSPVTLVAGDIMIAVFGNLYPGSAISGSISRSAGTTGTFGINYLSFDGSNYVSMGSQTGATASNLNIATYAVPVPAPALLAGAGLVGAAALRRRMSKKA